MRLCLITDTLCDANGVSRFIQDIAAQARQKEKAFYAFSVTRKKHCQSADNIYILKPRFTIKMPFYHDLDLVIVPPAWRLFKEIRRKRPDLIHISTPGTIGLCGLLVAKLLKIPVMGTYHTDFPAFLYSNTKSTLAKKVTALYLRVFYRNFKAIFIRSEVYRPIVKETLKIDNDKIITIPPGIDLSRFDHTLRDPQIWRKYNVPEEAVKALYVGRMTREKNIPFLLDIWKRVHHINKDIWLIMIGSGHYYGQREAYEKYHIRFLGHREGKELATLYASSDMFLFPSTTDTLGQVVIEAMQSGLPVLVSDRGGPQTIVNQNTENGLILHHSDAKAWVMAINALAKDEKRRKKLSENGLNTAQKLTISESFDAFWSASCRDIS